MNTLRLTRVAHVLPIVEHLKAAGVTVDHELRKWSLPVSLAQQPDGYLPRTRILECLRAIDQREGVPDPGYWCFRRWRLSQLNRDVLAQIRNGPTLDARLETFAHLCPIEDTGLGTKRCTEGTDTRIIVSCAEASFRELRYSEWLALAILLGLIRDTAGGQRPQVSELTLRASYIPFEAYSAFPDTRLVSGSDHTSIVVPTRLLSRPAAATASLPDVQTLRRTERALAAVNDTALTSRLKLVLGSYLLHGHPPIALAAEVFQISVRSLQRRLAQTGASYSRLIQEVRFEQAARMLIDKRTKVIDIALSLGYDDASHFSRAFRRVCGTSPREYRRTNVAQ